MIDNLRQSCNYQYFSLVSGRLTRFVNFDLSNSCISQKMNLLQVFSKMLNLSVQFMGIIKCLIWVMLWKNNFKKLLEIKSKELIWDRIFNKINLIDFEIHNKSSGFMNVNIWDSSSFHTELAVTLIWWCDISGNVFGLSLIYYVSE